MTQNKSQSEKPRRYSAVDPTPERVSVRLKTVELSIMSYVESLARGEGEGIEDEIILETAEKFEKHVYRKVIIS
jgi:hypothetical protein